MQSHTTLGRLENSQSSSSAAVKSPDLKQVVSRNRNSIRFDDDAAASFPRAPLPPAENSHLDRILIYRSRIREMAASVQDSISVISVAGAMNELVLTVCQPAQVTDQPSYDSLSPAA